eukprot:1665071-Prymnesium_polylepis.2
MLACEYTTMPRIGGVVVGRLDSTTRPAASIAWTALSRLGRAMHTASAPALCHWARMGVRATADEFLKSDSMTIAVDLLLTRRASSALPVRG